MIDLAILGLLTEQELHGYELKKRLGELLPGRASISFGSLYPALYRMTRKGWIRGEWGVSENNRRAKFYRLTRAGERQLAEEASGWERLSHAVSRAVAASARSASGEGT